MNLRIAPEYLRFRIGADEFAKLLDIGLLESATQYAPTMQLAYVIRTNSAAASGDGHILELASEQTNHGTRFELTVFGDGVAQLQSGQCDKDGIKDHHAFVNGELLSLGLEIDLHSRKGKN